MGDETKESMSKQDQQQRDQTDPSKGTECSGGAGLEDQPDPILSEAARKTKLDEVQKMEIAEQTKRLEMEAEKQKREAEKKKQAVEIEAQQRALQLAQAAHQ
ncbi:unnamed protein product [Caretta caretta]